MLNIRRSLFFSLAQQYGCAAVSFLTILVIARLLSPAEIGVFAVGSAVVGIAHMLRDFGINKYLVQEQDLTRDRVRTAFGVAVIISWSIAIVIYTTRTIVAQFYGEQGLSDILLILSCNFLIIPFGSIVLAILSREMCFKNLFVINFASSIVHSATSIILALLGVGYMSLAWASLAGVLTTTIGATASRWDLAFLLPSLRAWRRIIGFSSYASGSSIVLEIGNAATDLILGRMAGFEPVGIYSRAQGLVALVRRDIIHGIMLVAFPALARIHRDGGDLCQPFLRGTAYLAVIAWPVLCFFAVLAGPIIELMFGRQWIASAPILQILCIANFTLVFTSMSSQLIMACGLVKVVFKYELVIQSLRILLVLIGSLHSLEAVALLQAIPNILSAVLYIRALSLSNIAWSSLVRPVIQSLGVTSLSILGPISVSTFMSDSQFLIAVVAISGITWVLGWCIGVILINHPILAEVKMARDWLSMMVRTRLVQQ